MATFTDGRVLAASQQRRFHKSARSLQVHHQKLAEDMKDEAVALSQGKISTATLAAMGHPFGRKGGRVTLRRRVRVASRGMAPLLPINEQTGRLARSWRLFKRTHAQSWHSLQLQNVSPESKFVLNPGGTKKMVARGFWARMNQIYKQKARSAFAAMRRANSQTLHGG